jgi:hypothetical protein
MTTKSFNSAWRAISRIEQSSVKQAETFIQMHYLKKRPAIVLLCLMMICNNEAVGCILYSAPPMQSDKRYKGKTWELSRLYLIDRIPCNAETWLIGQSIRHIKRHHPDVHHLVSYADPSAGHQGTIYKAANWRPDGRTDDDRKNPRCDYVDVRTGKKYGRAGNVPKSAEVQKVPRISKHRFHYSIYQRTPQP